MRWTDGDDLQKRQQQSWDDCAVLICLLASNDSEANCYHYHYSFVLLLRSVINVQSVSFFGHNNRALLFHAARTTSVWNT